MNVNICIKHQKIIKVFLIVFIAYDILLCMMDLFMSDSSVLPKVQNLAPVMWIITYLIMYCYFKDKKGHVHILFATLLLIDLIVVLMDLTNWLFSVNINTVFFTIFMTILFLFSVVILFTAGIKLLHYKERNIKQVGVMFILTDIFDIFSFIPATYFSEMLYKDSHQTLLINGLDAISLALEIYLLSCLYRMLLDQKDKDSYDD